MKTAFCDGLGVACSVGCAVHCAVMPFAIAWLPALGAEWLAGGEVHVWMAAVCFGTAIAAVLPGYYRHRRMAVPMLAAVGVLALVAALFLTPSDCCAAPVCASCENDDTPLPSVSTAAPQRGSFLVTLLTPMGGLFLVSAHLLNRRECKCCNPRLEETNVSKTGT